MKSNFIMQVIGAGCVDQICCLATDGTLGSISSAERKKKGGGGAVQYMPVVQLLGRVRWEDDLNPGVQYQPGQESKTHILKKVWVTIRICPYDLK
jgi:hypothetical protein